ncbi:MAG: EamA family transporter [Euryarchaeota archaeon]|nr:EamA family transporter [Euryarchaeota archaeon]
MSASASSKPQPLVLAAFVATVLFLGVNFVAVRFSNRELAPFWGASLRFAVASMILFAVVAAKRIPLPSGQALIGAALFGAFAFGANFALVYYGLVTVPSGMAAVTFATIPLTTFLMAIGFGLERFRRLGLLGALVSIVGIAVVFQEQLSAAVPVLSLLSVFAAALFAAASGIIVKGFPRSHPIAANAVGMAVGTAILFPLSLAFHEPQTFPVATATWGALGWLIVSSMLAFVLMVWVLSHWTASANAYGSVLAPLVTIVVAASIAGEAVTGALVVGGIFVMVGVYVGALMRERGKTATGSAPGAATPDANR